MTGWRVGYAGGPKPMIQAMMNMQGQATAGVSTVGQAAVTAALEGPQDLIESHRADYQNRRNLVVGWLREAKGITCHKPEGAFYVFPNIAGCIGKTTPKGKKLETDTDFVTALLEERHVATVQGTAYGMSRTSASPMQRTSRASARAASASRSSAPTSAEPSWCRAAIAAQCPATRGSKGGTHAYSSA
jgi:aspartate/methionine/tyrosine aminotransferase